MRLVMRHSVMGHGVHLWDACGVDIVRMRVG